MILYRRQQGIGYNKSGGLRGGATPKRGLSKNTARIIELEFYITGTIFRGTYWLQEVPATKGTYTCNRVSSQIENLVQLLLLSYT
jgi:hypothetical protein